MSENYKLIGDLAAKDALGLVEKGKAYGDSWKKRGGVGAFMMLARKWDRIENVCKANGYDVFTAAAEDVSDIMDDIEDLRRYLLLVQAHVLSEVRIAPKPLPGVAPTPPATPVPPTSATAHQQPTTLSQCRHCGAVGNHAGFPCPQYQYDQMRNRVGCGECGKNPCECGKPTRDYVDQG